MVLEQSDGGGDSNVLLLCIAFAVLGVACFVCLVGSWVWLEKKPPPGYKKVGSGALGPATGPPGSLGKKSSEAVS